MGNNIYQTVFLDLDGTIIDSEQGIVNSVLYALRKFGIERQREKLLPFIGPPLISSFQEYTGLTKEEAEKAVEYYRENFSVKGVYEYKLYDGIKECLQELKAVGRRIVIATSKPENYAEMIVKHAGIEDYFDYICGGTMDGSRLTKEDVIEYALKKCGLQSGDSSVIMVGDRKHDIIGAKAYQLASAGVLYGFGNMEELQSAGADYLFLSPAELLHFLKSGLQNQEP